MTTKRWLRIDASVEISCLSCSSKLLKKYDQFLCKINLNTYTYVSFSCFSWFLLDIEKPFQLSVRLLAVNFTEKLEDSLTSNNNNNDTYNSQVTWFKLVVLLLEALPSERLVNHCISKNYFNLVHNHPTNDHLYSLSLCC